MYQNNSLRLLLASVLIFTIGAATGQNAAMSLNDCIDYALTNHPDIRVAELQVKDADWQIKENKGSGLPQFKAGLDYQYFIQRPGIPQSALFPGGSDEKVAFNANHSLAPSIALNQLIYSRSYGIALKAAQYYREYSQAGLAVTRQKMVGVARRDVRVIHDTRETLTRPKTKKNRGDDEPYADRRSFTALRRHGRNRLTRRTVGR